ncbi:Caskin-1 [Larimichthys crocea]|uniref:Uncharacterized protein n=1 Tax=Larimichthys crocea TaxID=215358 RepID=A0ACD3RWP2_LARCR|nr:Caskin-1 [Larimichthys crocea]
MEKKNASPQMPEQISSERSVHCTLTKREGGELLGAAKRVNVNIQDADGLSPLHHAALSGNKELIALLLEAQAAVDIKDHKANNRQKKRNAPWLQDRDPSGSRAANISISYRQIQEGIGRNLRADGRYNPSWM